MKKLMIPAALGLMVVLIGAAFLLVDEDTDDNNSNGNGDGLKDNEKNWPMTFTDDTGGKVTLDRPPKKVITLTPALTEIMFELELEARIVGCDGASGSLEGAGDIKQVLTYNSMDLESIVGLEPDLVLMDKTLDLSEENYNALNEADMTVYRVYPTTFQDLLDIIKDISVIMGVEEKGTRVVSDIEDRREEVIDAASSIDDDDKPTILHVTYYDGTGDPWVMTDSTFSGDLIEMAGGKCAISDSGGMGIQVSVESVISADPDIIITSQSSAWPTQSRETILTDDRWLDIAAVQSGEVHDIDGDLIDRTGPRMIEGLEVIHELITDHLEE